MTNLQKRLARLLEGSLGRRRLIRHINSLFTKNSIYHKPSVTPEKKEKLDKHIKKFYKKGRPFNLGGVSPYEVSHSNDKVGTITAMTHGFKSKQFKKHKKERARAIQIRKPIDIKGKVIGEGSLSKKKVDRLLVEGSMGRRRLIRHINSLYPKHGILQKRSATSAEKRQKVADRFRKFTLKGRPFKLGGVSFEDEDEPEHVEYYSSDKKGTITALTHGFNSEQYKKHKSNRMVWLRNTKPRDIKGKVIERIPRERQIGEGSLNRKRADRLFKAAKKKSMKGKYWEALPMYKKVGNSTARNLMRIRRDKRLD